MDAKLNEIVVQFANDTCDISQFSVKDLNLEIIVKKPYTQVKATLKDLVIIDCDPKSLYPTVCTYVILAFKFYVSMNQKCSNK